MGAIEETDKVVKSLASSIELFQKLTNDDIEVMLSVLLMAHDLLNNDLMHYQLTNDEQRFVQNIAYTENFLRKHNEDGIGIIKTFYMGVVEQLHIIVEQNTTSTTRHAFESTPSKYEQEKQYNLRHLREEIKPSRGDEIYVLLKNGAYASMHYSSDNGKSFATKDDRTIEVYRDYGLDEAPYKEK
jgi:hypothetical protein